MIDAANSRYHFIADIYTPCTPTMLRDALKTLTEFHGIDGDQCIIHIWDDVTGEMVPLRSLRSTNRAGNSTHDLVCRRMHNNEIDEEMPPWSVNQLMESLEQQIEAQRVIDKIAEEDPKVRFPRRGKILSPVVRAYDPNTGQWESITGLLYSPTEMHIQTDEP